MVDKIATQNAFLFLAETITIVLLMPRETADAHDGGRQPRDGCASMRAHTPRLRHVFLALVTLSVVSVLAMSSRMGVPARLKALQTPHNLLVESLRRSKLERGQLDGGVNQHWRHPPHHPPVLEECLQDPHALPPVDEELEGHAPDVDVRVLDGRRQPPAVPAALPSVPARRQGCQEGESGGHGAVCALAPRGRAVRRRRLRVLAAVRRLASRQPSLPQLGAAGAHSAVGEVHLGLGCALQRADGVRPRASVLAASAGQHQGQVRPRASPKRCGGADGAAYGEADVSVPEIGGRIGHCGVPVRVLLPGGRVLEHRAHGAGLPPPLRRRREKSVRLAAQVSKGRVHQQDPRDAPLAVHMVSRRPVGRVRSSARRLRVGPHAPQHLVHRRRVRCPALIGSSYAARQTDRPPLHGRTKYEPRGTTHRVHPASRGSPKLGAMTPPRRGAGTGRSPGAACSSARARRRAACRPARPVNFGSLDAPCPASAANLVALHGSSCRPGLVHSLIAPPPYNAIFAVPSSVGVVSKLAHGDRDRFLDKHPEFEGRGEGYASHYDVPAATSENVIVEKKSATIRVNLQGIAIGNGLVTQVGILIRVDATHRTGKCEGSTTSVPRTTERMLVEQQCVHRLRKLLLKLAVTGAGRCQGSITPHIRKACDSSNPAECYRTTRVTKLNIIDAGSYGFFSRKVFGQSKIYYLSNMVRLNCVMVGVQGNIFHVDVDESELVSGLKGAIKKETPDTVKCEADKLQLFLAMKEDSTRSGSEEWLKADSGDVEKLKQGEKTAAIEALMGKQKASIQEGAVEDILAGTKPLFTNQVHVLVVPTEDEVESDSETEPSARTRQLQFLDKLTTDKKRKRYCHSEMNRNQGWGLLEAFELTVKPIGTIHAEVATVDPFDWESAVLKDGQEIVLTEEQQRGRYREYLERNIGAVLKENRLCVIGVDEGENILSVDVPKLGIELQGRTDLLVLSDIIEEDPLSLMYLPEVKMLIEVKREVVAVSDFQAFSELIALDLLSEDP
ncbi:hypothetical protein ON010_g9309 [Phytophthora cinnamomi]|nr:hypothetical protein ON010_g9309 [Phytophthora cinnamomi]